jgi:3D (Asp-Asp-Asp) domain-containing protein
VNRAVLGAAVAGVAAWVACAGVRPPEEPRVEPRPAPRTERTLEVTATAYNATPAQTSGDPNTGAWGHRLEPGMKAVAVSPDLLDLGLGPEREIRIEGVDGAWRVLDRMPARWSRRIDLFMGDDVEAARAWGKRRVRIHWE